MKNVLSLLLLCAAALWAVPEPWSVVSQKGRVQVSWNGKKVISEVSLGGFAPDYKKMRYGFVPGNPILDGDGVRFEHKKEIADSKVALQFAGNTMTISLDAMVQPEGPFEFGIWLPFENFLTAEGNCFARANGQSLEIGKEAFASLGCSKVVFDLPEARHTITLVNKPGYMAGFQLQDRRKTGENRLRYIGTFRTQGDKPVAMKAEITWTVESFEGNTLAMRKALLQNPVITSVPVEFPNPAYEDGAAGWEMPKNASIVEEQNHGKVARLHVDDPKTEAVYITRLIPVVGGAWYNASVDVRTEDVMPKAGKMSSVGAGLIMEWADKNGKWMDGGSYACGRFGTSDWKKQECTDLRAPEAAGYAFVYLALRGAGTVYFDNFAMTRQDRNVQKISPEMGQVLASNVPLFQWLNAKGVNSYEVQLSQNVNFPENATRSYKLKLVKEFQLTEPLEKGRWYWRVIAPGMQDKHPWYFEQTVDKNVDCQPPIITANAKRVLKADDASYTITVQDNVDKNPKILVSDAKGTVYGLKAFANNQYRVVPQTGWAEGLNTLTVTAIDNRGNKATKQAWVLNAPKPEKVIVIDKNGNYSENGKTIFPLGLYEVHEPEMDEVRESGFEVIHTYAWESSQNEDACKKYLDDCVRHGLRAFIGFDRGNGTGNGMVQGNFACIANRVGAQASHPGLFCWYLFDEPEVAGQYISPELMNQYADLVRALDPYHPVVLTTWGLRMNNYRHTWDTHWTQSYSKPAKVVWQLDQHRTLLLNNSPITLLIHCYDQRQTANVRAGMKPDFNDYEPDYDWMNACAFVGFAKDVNGLWWWWYAKTQKQFVTAAQNPERWNDVCRMIKNVRAFREVYSAEGKTERGTFEFPKEDDVVPKVEWWVKHLANGKQAIIIVNTSEQPRKGSIDIPGAGKVDFDLPRFGVYTKY